MQAPLYLQRPDNYAVKSFVCVCVCARKLIVSDHVINPLISFFFFAMCGLSG